MSSNGWMLSESSLTKRFLCWRSSSNGLAWQIFCSTRSSDTWRTTWNQRTISVNKMSCWTIYPSSWETRLSSVPTEISRRESTFSRIRSTSSYSRWCLSSSLFSCSMETCYISKTITQTPSIWSNWVELSSIETFKSTWCMMSSSLCTCQLLRKMRRTTSRINPKTWFSRLFSIWRGATLATLIV